MRTAMVLAAGLGTRMRPITDNMPKPLVRVGGKTLLDWGIDRLDEAGIKTVIVNTHYFSEMIADHLETRPSPRFVLSHERECLLDSAGGIINALPEIGDTPFFVLNADSFWLECEVSAIHQMVQKWDPVGMDMLLLLVAPKNATGHSGGGDFLLQNDGLLVRGRNHKNALIYCGFAILHPRIFYGAVPGRQSLNLYFDRAIEAQRMFGHCLQGHWITVGTPEAVGEAESTVAKYQAQIQ